ncbi:DUF6542 domain-containing protein [Streptomyces sp. NPDC093260]|uniref:DUF6542 domain-containing protein n=1 Tax=Streptomyces sp. NPDC093260 TaxID=3155073 RepID=UPI00341AAB35
MEQHRTRPQQYGPRRGRPPATPQGIQEPVRPSARPRPRPAAGGARGPDRPAPRRAPAAAPPVSAPASLVRRLRRLPNPRLTGLGGGLFCGALMFALGCLDALLLDASPAGYGVLFVPVCALTALWVRRGDLLTAPVVVPIGFAVGLLPVADGDGVLGTLMGLVTALATHAVWLYAGTLVAGATALLRRAALAATVRSAARSRRPEGGRCRPS